jgi:hypothetical protein
MDELREVSTPADVGAELADLAAGLGIVTMALFPLALPALLLLAPLALPAVAVLLVASPAVVARWIARFVQRQRPRRATAGVAYPRLVPEPSSVSTRDPC